LIQAPKSNSSRACSSFSALTANTSGRSRRIFCLPFLPSASASMD
jgi:hypothetical protein